MADQHTPDEVTKNISESADKIQLKTATKRGTGTRDEDKVKVRVKGDDPDETAQALAETLDALERHGVADQLRDQQPEGDQ